MSDSGDLPQTAQARVATERLAADLRGLGFTAVREVAARAALWAAVLGLLAGVAWSLAPPGASLGGVLLVTGGALLVPAYCVLGLLLGAGFGLASALTRALIVVGRGLRELLAAALTAAATAIFAGRGSLDAAELSAALERYLAPSLAGSRRLRGLALRYGARVARAVLVREIARAAVDGRITPATVARVAGDRVLDLAVATPAARLRLLRWGLAALATLPALAVLRWWPGAP